MLTAGIATFIYATLILIGGLVGYVKAGSVPSLVSAAACALLLNVGGVLLLTGRAGGWPLALGVTLVLALFGGGSWLGARKPFVPRGLIFVLSLVQLAALLALRR